MPAYYLSLSADAQAMFLEADSLRQVPRRAQVQAFRIGRYEVTNEQYAEFVNATDHTPPPHWQSLNPPAELLQHPVVNVTYGDAVAYVRWRGLRLPTADEWERAARAGDGRLYPWGRSFDSTFANTEESGRGTTTEVTLYRKDASPYGVMGMGGNVTEWTATPMEGTDGSNGYVVSGGSWLEAGEIVSLAPLRRWGDPNLRYSDVGFRVAQ